MNARSRPLPDRVAKAARALLRSERGAAAPLLGLVFLILIGCVGFAVDTGRSMVVKARLTNALDAAGLAVGARLATSDYTADAKKYVTANFKANYAGATVTEVTATPNNDKTVIALTATATMPTAFMKLFGVNLVTVKATTEITRASQGLELVMVLDNTGSMEKSGSMPSLKSAATSLVNILYGDDATAKSLYVGLVPFSQAVNVGTGRLTWVNSTSLLKSYYPLNWTGCVEARTGTLEQTDDPPSLLDAKTLFNAYYSPNTYNPKNPNSNESKQNPWIKTFFGLDYLDIKYVDYDTQQGPSAYCPSTVTPLTNVKATVVNGINGMKAAGSTMIDLGAAWGWRMLSPRWRGLWGGDMASFKLPLDYDTKNMSKAMVLMTDGENDFAKNNYTAYGELDEGKLGTTDKAAAEAELNKRLATVCNAMKAKGVVVYAVAFNNPGTTVKQLLQNCATSTSFYFDAANGAALVAAFQTIGSSLSQLRVSK